MSALLDVQDLRVNLPLADGVLNAVRGVSFTVNRGETLCIVGESGSGKSLTALALMDLLPRNAQRSAERMSFAGTDIASCSRRTMEDLRGNRIAMIFQDPMSSLNPSLTIGVQLTEILRRHKPVSRTQALDRAVFLLGKVGITAPESRLRQYPHQLSGGLRQRVMIAMALMCGPDLLIADEPTTALDVTIQAQILRVLADLQKEFGVGLVFITHDLGLVSRIGHRVAVMYAGQIVEYGSARAIFRHTSHPYTSGLLACLPEPGRIKPGERLGSIPGIVPNLIGMPAQCGFANRCSHAVEQCTADDVPMVELPHEHFSRCLFAQRFCSEAEQTERSAARASG
ncbi:MAG: ABC transporter ATP-binding protein [Salinarimonadaceae bacterium]|nr:MAG: ABC transporter ATP-binding protein [Salinarimonadaceae bacterium]